MFKQEHSKLEGLISITVLVLVVYVLIKDFHNVQSLILKSGVWAPIVAVILYSMLSPTPISTDPITIVVGSIYGPYIGALIAFIGNSFAGLVEYFIGTRIDKATNFGTIQTRLPLGLSKLPVNSTAFLIFGRLIPFYGGKIISILAGMYRVPIKKYLWTTLVTTFLGSLLLAFGGFHIINLLIKK